MKLQKTQIVKSKNLHPNHRTRKTALAKIIKMRLKFKRLVLRRPKRVTLSKMKILRLKKNGGKRKSLIMTNLIRKRKLIPKKLKKLQRKWQNLKNLRKRQRKRQKRLAMRLKKLSMRRKKQSKISKKVKPS